MVSVRRTAELNPTKTGTKNGNGAGGGLVNLCVVQNIFLRTFSKYKTGHSETLHGTKKATIQNLVSRKNVQHHVRRLERISNTPSNVRPVNVFITLSSKKSSSSGMVNSNSHVTSDPETVGTNLITTTSKKSRHYARTHAAVHTSNN